MFSFRAAVFQDSSPALPPDTTRSTLADSPVTDCASASTNSTARATSGVRSRERSFSEAAAARRDGSSTVACLLNVSQNDLTTRPRSLNLSSSASDMPQVRASCSAESLLEFNHPDSSHSTLSLSLSYHSLHGHERPGTPVTVAASSKSADMLPRPPPKAKPKRRENISFPYFVTPLVLTTANPYIVPPTPPSSPTSTKADTMSISAPKLAGTSFQSGTPTVRDVPVKEPHASSQEAIDELPPAPATIFQKITGAPRKRLVSRPSADGFALSSSSSTLASLPTPQPPSTTARPRVPSRAPPAPTVTGPDAALRSIANAGEDKRVKIALARKTRVDVDEARDVGEVLPRLQMLRAQ